MDHDLQNTIDTVTRWLAWRDSTRAARAEIVGAGRVDDIISAVIDGVLVTLTEGQLRALILAHPSPAPEVCPTCRGWAVGLVTGRCKCPPAPGASKLDQVPARDTHNQASVDYAGELGATSVIAGMSDGPGTRYTARCEHHAKSGEPVIPHLEYAPDAGDLISRDAAIAWCDEQHQAWALTHGRDPAMYASAFTNVAGEGVLCQANDGECTG